MKKSQKIIPVQHGRRPCWLCGTLAGNWGEQNVHRHHIFDGKNRRLSEKYGLTVDLCLAHHTAGLQAVHNNAAMMKIVQQYGQQMFEARYGHDLFMQEFGKNYL